MSCVSRGQRGRGLRRRHRLSLSGAPITALIAALITTVVAGVIPAAAGAAELGAIVAVPAAGQTADQLRRDRYECHNWVIAQNGTVPAPGPGSDAEQRERRAARVGKVVTGAAVGAAAGGVIRGAHDYREADEGALAGGVLGAIVGAVIGAKQEHDSEDDSFNEYFRALDACMTARGYELSIAGEDD